MWKWWDLKEKKRKKTAGVDCLVVLCLSRGIVIGIVLVDGSLLFPSLWLKLEGTFWILLDVSMKWCCEEEGFEVAFNQLTLTKSNCHSLSSSHLNSKTVNFKAVKPSFNPLVSNKFDVYFTCACHNQYSNSITHSL